MRQSAGKAITAGWTLVGRPAEAMAGGIDDACVIVLRPHGTSPTEENLYAEGPLPGIGRVAIGIAQSLGEHSIDLRYTHPDLLAAYEGGGFGSTSLRFGGAGDPIGVPENPNAANFTPRYVDPSRRGVWWATHSAMRPLCKDELPAMVLIGKESRCVHTPFDGAAGGYVEGGDVSALGPAPAGYLETRVSSDGVVFVAHHTDAGLHVYRIAGAKLEPSDPKGWDPSRFTEIVVTERAILGFQGNSPRCSFARDGGDT